MSLEKLNTGVPGLDTVLNGGFPRGSLVLVAGPPGAGKSILATQIAFYHARQGKRILLLTVLSETNAKLVAYLQDLEYFDPELIGNGVQILSIQKMLTDEGMDAALAEIRSHVVSNHIELLVLDSLRSLNTTTGNESAVQSFVFSLGSALFILGCTTLLVGDQYRADSSPSSEEAISDTILALEASKSGWRTVRRLEAVKVRGADPLDGRHSFEITSEGVQVYPRIESLPEAGGAPQPRERLSWGVPGMDELTNGGIPAYTTTLLTGAAGIGKTTFCLQFVAEGIRRQEKCLFVTLYESADELLGKARALEIQLEAATESGYLQVLEFPVGGLDSDKFLHTVLTVAREEGISRLVIDNIDPIEHDLLRDDRFSQVVASLARFLRSWGVTTVITRELTQLIGQDLDITSGRGAHWTPLDNLLLMRPVELDGSLRRLISVLKMRSSSHDESFYCFGIGAGGVTIEGGIEGLQGLLTGTPRKAG